MKKINIDPSLNIDLTKNGITYIDCRTTFLFHFLYDSDVYLDENYNYIPVKY